jgi:hypothetical protein
MARPLPAQEPMSGRFPASICAALLGLLLGAISARLHLRAALPAPGLTESGSALLPRHAIQGGASQSEQAMGVAMTALTGNPDLLDLARLGEELDHLDSKQVAKLLDRLDREQSGRDDRMIWLFLWWIKRDPKAAAAWIQPRVNAVAQDGPPGFYFYESGAADLMLAWAKADPRAAMDFARAHGQSGLSRKLPRVAGNSRCPRGLEGALACRTWPTTFGSVILAVPPGQAAACPHWSRPAKEVFPTNARTPFRRGLQLSIRSSEFRTVRASFRAS